MFGRPSTTIGFELLYNPLARLDRALFLATLTAAIPARPLNMTAIEATNRGLADMPWAMLTTAPAVQEVDVEALETRPPAVGVRDGRGREDVAPGQQPGRSKLPQDD